MTTSEWLSVIAIVISSGGLAIQLRNWLMEKPRLHLSVMAEALVIPDDGRGDRAALTVINRGGAPTMITHMVAFTYTSRAHRLFRRKPTMSGIVNSTDIPFKLEVNAHWVGQMLYTDDLKASMKRGMLYLGIYASHSNKPSIKWARPPKPKDVPTQTVATG